MARMFILGGGFMAGLFLAALGAWVVVDTGSAHASDTPAMFGALFLAGGGLILGAIGLALAGSIAVAARRDYT